MPYIGNEVGNRFVASKAASVYSGNGSTTAFTLEHAVGSDEDILVSVDGVIQEPSVAYAVSNGTTLTFTAAPSSNSGNNIFVYYLFRTVATVDHPSTSSLQATDGTFSSTLNVTGETTLATHLNMGDNDIIKVGAGSDIQIYHDGSYSRIMESGGTALVLDTTSTDIRLTASNSEVMGKFIKDGAVELYHNNNKKIETTSAGATLTGNLTVTDGHVSSGVNHTYNLFGATGTGGSASYVTYSFVGDPNTGMFSGTADTLKFATGGSERMRVVSSGVFFDTTNTNPAENNVAGIGILSGGKISASADGNFGLQVNRKSSFGGVIHLRKDGSGGGFLGLFDSSSAARLLLGNDNTCLLFNDTLKSIIPHQSTGALQDNVIDLGTSSGRFGNVFAANGSIQTSDRNEKQDIEELSEAEKKVAIVAKSLMRKFKWKDAVAEKGDKARTHFGIIAQDLQDAFTAEGLDATKYGMFCSDTWWDNDEVFVDDDGKEHKMVKSYYTEEEAPEGATKKTRLAVRYNELFAFIISTL